MAPPPSTERSSPTALICTLGGKPQVATFALDALLARGVPASRLIAIHLSLTDPRLKRSVEMIREQVATHYSRREIAFEHHPIRPVRSVAPGTAYPVYGTPIERIDDPAAPEAVWMTMHALIARLKSEGYVVHLCVTGGPRLIGLQALSAASLLLGSGDECWHLFTPEDLRTKAGEGEILHAPEGAVRLVKVPLLPLGNLAPSLRHMAFASPQDVIAVGARQFSHDHVERCRTVKAGLTRREMEVLRVFAEGVRSLDEAAKRLGVTVSTVRTHAGKIYDHCRAAWDEPPDARLNFRDVRERFGGLPREFWE